MDIEKLIQVVGYMLKKNNGKMNYTKLIKLLYLADRQSIDETDVSITGDTYYSMDDGPVLSTLYDLIKGNAKKEYQQIWDTYFSTVRKNEGFLLAKIIDISDDKIPLYAFDILDSVGTKFKDFRFGQMINYVHNNCPEWKPPNGSSIKIEKATILEKLGRTQEQIDDILEEDEMFNKEELYSCV